jgi:PKD domain
MTTSLRMVRKAPIWVFPLIVLTVELTIFGSTASAQNYGTGPASPPSASPSGNAISSGASRTTILPSASVGAINASQAPPNGSLLGVPVYGTAPLTVDFYVGTANPHSPLVYQWNFGDGAVSLVSAGVYTLHVYQNPGTYRCSLTLTTAQGVSTTLFTTITVEPRQL